MKRFLHPSKKVAECKDYYNKDKIEGLLITGRGEQKLTGGSVKPVIYFRHSSFEGTVLYCHEKYAKVTTEGPEESAFVLQEGVAQQRNHVARSPEPCRGKEIPADLFHSTSASEDILALRNLGFIVDNDNDPAPENVPEPSASSLSAPSAPAPSSTPYSLSDPSQEWKDVYVDTRKADGTSHDIMPSLPGLNGKNPKDCTYLELFLMFLGDALIKNIVLKATNNNLPEGTAKISYGEFLRWIGLWILMSTSVGFVRADYWSSDTTRRSALRKVPYNFNDYMSRRRFDTILKHLTYTTFEAPTHLDKFWQVRQMIAAWNSNMVNIFSPGWAVCLDESMSIWTSRWSCPGWVFCPRKPHPMGNEYHSMACGLCSIMFAIDLVEGSDRPKELPSQDPARFGPTVSLLLRMCQGIYHSGRVVILDSGFCVLKGIVELFKRGVYAGAVIKKRRYWPKHIPGDAIDLHMDKKDIGAAASLTGKLDGVNYTVFAMKEPDYTSKIMATYGSLASDDRWEMRSRRVTKSDGTVEKKYFKYILPFQNHFTYRHAVDDHNNHRHQVPSIEETWKTFRWENRVFAFLLALSEVNCWLALRYFVWGEREDEDVGENSTEKTTLLFFRIKLGHSLVQNPFLPCIDDEDDESEVEGDGTPKRKRRSTRLLIEAPHQYVTAPKKASKFLRGTWILSHEDAYQRKVCTTKGCTARTRCYCSCSIGQWLCVQCYGDHRENESSHNS
jgi:hypothetical protein